ncbi:hypothetical protein FisN_23Lh132 [Fistulifera solaris]|uniref:Uncharacterized protein n=1 Tax=Fistulifera solaris TaxID=1519565 RepID=A0A1Z5KLY9_FISSO|nr:hypothetical protein FisN_23Lh132 [Fistulifera solaris]|eukprot:GAX27299.1 hypothetical protein FisN_23Lh132 [Fistulifera solaris]
MSDPSKSHKLQKWRRELITKDDPVHLHKTLGFLCLISYIWRLSQWGPERDMGFATHPQFTLPTIFLHLLLNLSSFEFQLPPRRIDSGYRIWPEYRAHSLVFLCRSLATMLLTYYEQVYHKPPNYWMNLVIVLVTMAAADTGSRFTDHQSGFSRKLQVPNMVKYYFSVAQLWATAGIIYGIRRYSVQLLYCLIIQVNAFLMTLRRKNLAGHYLLVSVYGFLLVSGILTCTIELFLWDGWRAVLIFGIAANTASVIRLAPRKHPLMDNKYLMWIFIGCLVSKMRQSFRETDKWMISLATISMVAMVSLGFYNGKYGYGRSFSTIKIS